jgi:DNA-directed RNA polymerase subunit RPC12/RpoP
MKLEATCNTCGRRFALVQILPEPDGTGGRCPFCGTNFGRHYVQVLPEVIEDAEAGADDLIAALEKLQGMHPGFRVDLKTLLRRINEELSPAEDETA